jgi:hypothetical protein
MNYSIRIDDIEQFPTIVTELWGTVRLFVHGKTDGMTTTDHVTVGVPDGEFLNTDTSFVVPKSVIRRLIELRREYPEFNIVPFDPRRDYTMSIRVNGQEFLLTDDSIIQNSNRYCSLTLPELGIRVFSGDLGSVSVNASWVYNPPKRTPIEDSETVTRRLSFTRTSRVCYYLSAIGEPHYGDKLFFLVQNLVQLRREGIDVDVFINHYDDSADNIREKIRGLANNVFTFKAKMRLGEFWSQSPLNAQVQNYENVLLMLDDVRFCSNFSLNTLIQKREEHSLDFISPMVLGCSHGYWYNGHRMTRNNFLEMFCYVMTPRVFKLYTELHSPSNRFAWGVDFIYGHIGMRCGVYRPCEVGHYFRDSGDISEACRTANVFVQLYGYPSTSELTTSFPPIAEVLEE